MEMFLLECADCRCKYAIDNERFELHNDEPWCPACHYRKHEEGYHRADCTLWALIKPEEDAK